MKLNIQREVLLKPLQQVIGAVEKRHTMQILGNVLLRCDGTHLKMTATDLEVELVAEIEHTAEEAGDITLPARKLLDICRALPESAEIRIQVAGERAVISSGRSRFILTTLPVGDFPNLDEIQGLIEFSLTEKEFLTLIDRTAFAMANQDARYYLNGLMLEMEKGTVRMVATDGHRLSLCALESILDTEQVHQVIIPRKGVLELSRLLEYRDDPVRIQIAANHLRVRVAGLCFTTKLIDGRFPDYRRVIPREGEQVLQVDRELLRQALGRTAILSNEKYRGVRIELSTDNMKLQSHNPDQEEAEEEMEVEYRGHPLEIGFNVTYLMDVVTHLKGEHLQATFKDAGSSVLIRDMGFEDALYVIMPMRL
ncbi:DNA polymerase-3 subunit beta [Ectothiorhodospira magna]|uniref:Beta sliding clamp n=1 Tax=Ectothiorhodospira magna TaxID=867345 RepID=A0A1H9EXI4_9GAMM|nr:DNA polymerase III subunit beta [Ectothiorhodospira magna]SEQ30420.1 DNA polymerase-3 subunit beta [Ectothiorhodospira magna]